MKIDSLLQEINDLSIKIYLSEGKLKLKAKEGKIPSAILEKVKSNKSQLIDYLTQLENRDQFFKIYPVEKQGYYSLSSAQQRLYLLQQIEPGSTAYNMPFFISLGSNVDNEKIRRTFSLLISRHESLRTRFVKNEEEFVQIIDDKVDLPIEEKRIGYSEIEKFKKEFVRPFDLSRSPLMRAAIIDIEGEEKILMLDFHHIIIDGLSHRILKNDFFKLYKEHKLIPLNIQYKDFSLWQNSKSQQHNIEKQKAYWIKQFEEEIPTLNLPTDFKRPAYQNFEGATVNFFLNEDQTLKIKQIAIDFNITLYMSLLSVYTSLLYRLSGQKEIVVGTPISGRNSSELEKTVGMFVNTLAIRYKLNGNETIKQYLEEIKEVSLGAFENQDFQFEELVNVMNIDRDPSRNPIFDVMFNLMNHSEFQDDQFNENIQEQIHTDDISKFDLTLTAIDYGSKIQLRFNYNTKLFLPQTIDRFIEYYKQIIHSIELTAEQKVSDIELLPENERTKILSDFNKTRKDYQKDNTICQIFREQAKKTPNNVAVIDGRKEISFKDLDEQSDDLAGFIVEKGYGKDTIISLLLDSSAEMIVCILGVLKSGAAFLPIHKELPTERIKYILSDSGSKLLLTDNDTETINKNVEQVNINKRIDVSKRLTLVEIGSDTLAYLIYTSGSTGKPKGVLVSHRNLNNYFSWFNSISNVRENDKTMLVTSYAFDLGYTAVFSSLLNGGQLHIVSKNLYLSPIRFAKYIVDQQITYLKLTPAVYNLLVDNENFKEVLKSIRLVVLGGEEINLESVKKSLLNDNKIKIINHYGPTESTIGCISILIEGNNQLVPSNNEKESELLILNEYGPTESSIGCITSLINRNTIQEYAKKPVIGKPINNTRIYILNEYNQIQPIGVQGELCISGDGLARGYLNNLELTDEKFINNPFEVEGRLYKTGDIACWLPDGNIEFLGRKDNQLKIRGYRVEIGEIENCILQHEKILETVIIPKEDNGVKYLCAYLVTDGELNVEDVREYLSNTLPNYMIPDYIIKLDSLPLTPNGKINRKELPEPNNSNNNQGSYVAPTNETERQLVKIWSDVLKGEEKDISITSSFFRLGGHSLKAAILLGRYYKQFSVELPLKDLFKYTTIKEQAKQIAKSKIHVYEPIPKAIELDYYSMAPGQKRLYVLHQIEPGSVTYNLPYFITLEKGADKKKIKKILNELIKRHESLRTSFVTVGEEIVQKINKNCNIDIEEYKINQSKVTEFRNQFIRPFDLSQSPIMRAAILNIDNGEDILLIDMHHIITDGVSQDILEEEFIKLNKGIELEPVKIQFKDFSQWQNNQKQLEKQKSQESFWLQQFDKEIPLLNLPTDFNRPSLQSHEGARVTFSITKEETLKLKEIGQKYETTLYMEFLTAFTILLYKLSGQDEIVVGTPIAGRNHPDLEKTVGMFINTLALKNEINEEEPILNLIERIKSNTLRAFENQEYQFEDLVDKVIKDRDPGRNPLFDVVFNFVDQTNQKGNFSKAEGNTFTHKPATSKFDLTLAAFDFGERVMLRFEYCTKLFAPETIERIIGYFKAVLNQIIDNPLSKVKDIRIVGQKETNFLLNNFNNIDAKYNKDDVLHKLFYKQVEEDPEAIALVYEKKKMTYSELNKRSNQLARILRENGTKDGTIVGLLVDRSFEMIIGILGILKAGGAYLPIDPNYPDDRIKYTLEDSKAKLFLTFEKYLNKINTIANAICIDNESIYVGDDSELENINKSSDLAYIIYTSGTTGKPKGSMIEHRNVVRLLFNNKFQFNFDNKDIWTLFHSYCFDFSVWEMYGALLYGGQLIIVAEYVKKDPAEYRKLLLEHKVTVLNQTPSSFYNLVNEDLSFTESLLNLNYVVFGGEALKPLKLKKWKEKYPKTKLINMYGITETTVHVTYKEITDSEINNNISNIGKPIPTLSTYILDKNQQLLPIGVPGEICVGGDGVCRGYLYKEKLTAERFIENPFIKNDILYRSGDLGRILSNGDLEYLGRIDNQVKIRGFRIELGEIESQLLKVKQIDEAIVIDRLDDNEEKYLCAYYVTHFDKSKKQFDKITNDQLRNILSKSLPDYMIPAYLIRLDSLPLTSNGKIDRKSLPKPKIEFAENIIPPKDKNEFIMVDIWSDVLNINKCNIGVDTNYFSIGGDSMKAIRLLSKINQEFKSKIKILDLYQNQTISQLVPIILLKQDECALDNNLNEIRAEVDKLKNQIIDLGKLDFVENIADLYPMSDIEKGMVYFSLVNPDSAMYHDQFTYQLSINNFDFKRFEKALALLVQKHHIFRTSFNFNDYNEPIQLVYKNVNLDTEFKDLSNLEREAQEQYIQVFLQSDRNIPFIPSTAPLWRLRVFQINKSEVVVTWSFHHAILDGWSNASFMTELNNTYLELGNNDEYRVEKLKCSYKDYIIEHIAAKRNEKNINFWKNKLEGYKRIQFPVNHNSKEVRSTGGRIVENLGIEFYDKLKELGTKLNTSVKHICFAAYAYMLNTLSYDNDVVAGLVSNNRPLKEDGDRILGCFLNTVPVRIKIPQNITFEDYIIYIEKTLVELKDYDKLSLLEIMNILGEKSSQENPFFDTIFNYVDFHVYNKARKEETSQDNISDKKQRLQIDGYENTNTLFDLSITATLGNFAARLVYSNSLISDDDAAKLFDYFLKVLKIFIEEPQKQLSKNEIISDKEKDKLLTHNSKSEQYFSGDKVIHQLFEEQVKMNPDDIAVIDGERRITYSELNEKSNRLAWTLISRNVQQGSIIGLQIEHSIELIIGILGILKSGACYLPIDSNYPLNRKKYIVKESALQLTLISNNAVEKLEGVEYLNLNRYEKLSNKLCNPTIKHNAENPAYIIYTSGSTGKPKGVIIRHSNLVNYIYWVGKIYSGRGNLNFPLYSSISFDLTVTSIFTPLIHGAKIKIFNAIDQGSAIKSITEDKDIGILKLTPSHLQLLVEDDLKNCSIKSFIVGGEDLTSKLAGSINPNIAIFNEYGPTEATVGCMIYKFNKERDTQKSVPIGKAAGNVELYILDNNQMITPIGVVGELCVSGKGLALGYLNNPQNTKEKFIKHPFKKGELLYRTGDLARWRNDGNMEFLGRIDEQVKIRGFRIELAEIEATILKYEIVKGCVVIVREEKGNKYLCAYIISRKSSVKEELTKFIANYLPDYMMPSYFVEMNDFPLTTNGKIDKKKLPIPEVKANSQYVGPTSELEEQLVNIWSEILDIDKGEIGIHDNFFDLGGHSITATILVNRISNKFGVKLDITQIFDLPTILKQSTVLQTFIETNAISEEDNSSEEVSKFLI